MAGYLSALPAERQAAMNGIRKTIMEHLPPGFEEVMSYGMIGYVVPHSMYPAGYHCNPKLPLPFINLASQKNFIALYHMGLYADPQLMEWFISEYSRQGLGKPDMGKSCIRFKKPVSIPYALLGALCAKISPSGWIAMYEQAFKRK